MSSQKDVSNWTGVPEPTRKIPRITRDDVRAYGIAALALAMGVTSTRLSWPLLAHTPFILIFGGVLAASNWGSEGAGVMAVVIAALASPYIAPPGARPAFEDGSLVIFILGALVANRIIAARARIERKLKASEAQVRASWDSAAVGTALLNSHGQVDRLNPAMERLLDYPSAAWAGTSFGYFTHKDLSLIHI